MMEKNVAVIGCLLIMALTECIGRPNFDCINPGGCCLWCPNEKPGTCPEIRMDDLCIPALKCAVDSDCSNNEKCCRTACGDFHRCSSPSLQRGGIA